MFRFRSKFVKLVKQFLGPLTIAALVSAPLSASAAVVQSDDTAIGRELQLPMYCWSDESVKRKGIIFAIHGATLYARRFDPLASHLARQGYTVYALDLRGFGRWRTEGEKFGGDGGIHYTQSELDVTKVLEGLRQAFPEEHIYCLGESLGANLAVWIGSQHSQLTDGLILASPCIKSVFHPGPRVFFDTVRGILYPNKEMSLTAYTRPYIASDPRSAADYVSDPQIYHSLTPVELMKSIKTNKLTLADSDKMPASMPVLIMAGKIDKVYKASAIPGFVSKMGSKHQTICVMPGRGHLLLETKYLDDNLLAIIDNWLSTGTSINGDTSVSISTAVKAVKVTSTSALTP